jgi:hypothetical protein
MQRYMQGRARTINITQAFVHSDPDKLCRELFERVMLPRSVVFPTTSPAEPITTTDGGAYHPVQEPKPSRWDRLWAWALGKALIGSQDG